MSKQHSQDKEDLQGLNIALDSKQQELELLKRKIGVRGTAGSTPAPASKIANRRDSAIFTATPAATSSRPPSVLSDAGTDGTTASTGRKERKNSSETPLSASGRTSALGKSTRVNSTAPGSFSSAKKPLSRTSSVDGAMGPPPPKAAARPSLVGTPTPGISARVASLSRSSSARTSMTPQSVTPVPHRRVSSVATLEQGTPSRTKIARATVNASPAPSVLSEVDEKENATPSSARKRVPVLSG
ncbi:unnamed protein product [Cyclocybe aegerita]|uniref:Uncharacterized protein n=1 Tax=Cyclocybe aegerita TaxID=1973307 RepID=A0A8S0WZE5_CYCAE|nr:unnamed protein product [Cyclocybe aegerita]